MINELGHCEIQIRTISAHIDGQTRATRIGLGHVTVEAGKVLNREKISGLRTNSYPVDFAGWDAEIQRCRSGEFGRSEIDLA